MYFQPKGNRSSHCKINLKDMFEAFPSELQGFLRNYSLLKLGDKIYVKGFGGVIKTQSNIYDVVFLRK